MPTTEEVRADLAEIVNEVAGVPADDVQLDKSFTDDLDVDSLSMVEIIYAAEEKFGVSIPDEEAKNLKTVGDAVAYIERAAALSSALLIMYGLSPLRKGLNPAEQLDTQSQESPPCHASALWSPASEPLPRSGATFQPRGTAC